LLKLAPLAALLCGCGSTLFLDKFESTPIGASPGQPDTGTVTSKAPAVIAADPRNDGSSDQWLKLSRTMPTAGGGEYVGTFTKNVTNTKVSVNLVGFVPHAEPIMLTVFFEPQAPSPPAPLLHIDLRTNGTIRVNDSVIAGTYMFQTLVGFFITFDLSGPSPSATILIRGGGNDANLTVPVPLASYGLGRVRIVAPFEGVNAPNGSFFVNDLTATAP
jgi:hypothetical protein